MAGNGPIHRKEMIREIAIRRDLLNEIIVASVGFPYETGGFIGLRGKQICYFMFDSGAGSKHEGRYYPNADSIKLFLEKWKSDRLSGIGILHTHLSGDSSLSKGDIKYIYQIFCVNPDMKEMYFPVVVPGKTLCMYLAERQGGNISIKPVTMKIT